MPGHLVLPEKIIKNVLATSLHGYLQYINIFQN